MKIKNPLRPFVITSISLYLISLTLPAFCLGQLSCDENIGIQILAFGGLVLFSDPIGLIWLANPILWLAWYLAWHRTNSFQLSTLVTILMLSFLLFQTAPNYMWCGGFLEQNTCPNMSIEHLGSGYIIWLASAIILFIGNLFNLSRQQLMTKLFFNPNN